MLPRWVRWLPGAWLGLLLGIGLIAAPSLFAVLPAADAGRVAARMFMHEAWLSLAFAAVLLLALRRPHQRGLFAARRTNFGDAALLWATAACTLLGYFAVAALMPAAREGQGLFSFGQLHGASAVFFGIKALLVLVLAWRAAGA